MKGQSFTCTYHLLPFYPTACSAGGSAHEGGAAHGHDGQQGGQPLRPGWLATLADIANVLLFGAENAAEAVMAMECMAAVPASAAHAAA